MSNYGESVIDESLLYFKKLDNNNDLAKFHCFHRFNKLNNNNNFVVYYI